MREVRMMLKRRGFSILKENPTEYLIFPRDMAPEDVDQLYEMMKKYSFRLFLRDVIKKRHTFGVEELVRYSTRQWVERYVELLVRLGIVERVDDGYRLKRQEVSSFGDTLEWFVSAVMEREFGADTLWGVRLGGVECGGDFDVIAGFEGRLLYVEVKSSPPGNIEEEGVVEFIKRVETLKPHVAIFLNDTRLRMKDKIVPFFESYFKEKGQGVERLKGELFGIKDRLFIANSTPDMVSNLGFCLERYLKSGFWL